MISVNMGRVPKSSQVRSSIRFSLLAFFFFYHVESIFSSATVNKANRRVKPYLTYSRLTCEHPLHISFHSACGHIVILHIGNQQMQKQLLACVQALPTVWHGPPDSVWCLIYEIFLFHLFHFHSVYSTQLFFQSWDVKKNPVWLLGNILGLILIMVLDAELF